MPPHIELCTCGHAHFGGAHCWCGCPAFDAGETDDSDYPLGQVQG